MAGYMHDSGYSQRRIMAFVAIIALHVFIAWAFITGFGQAMVAQIVKDVQVSIIKTDEVKETPPPPPKPTLDRPPPVSVPPPLINITIPIEAPPIQITREAPQPPRPVSIVPQTPVTFVRQLNVDDYYPEQSKRLDEHGSVTVRACVLPTGKLDGPPQVLSTSNFARLDEAAIRMASDTRYKAAVFEGKPIRACKDFRVVFRINST
jgi:periplasmic protein TonB